MVLQKKKNLGGWFSMLAGLFSENGKRVTRKPVKKKSWVFLDKEKFLTSEKSYILAEWISPNGSVMVTAHDVDKLEQSKKAVKNKLKRLV